MSGDSGFASGDSSGVNPFASGMLGGGFGGFGGFGGGFDEPAVDTGQHQGTGDAVIGQSADGASKTSTEIQEETKKPTLGSREQVLANPEQYGWKPGMTASPEEYAQQYFHEAAAKLSYKDPSIDGDKKGDPNAKDGYTAADKAFLEQWGYKVGPEVRGNGALGNTDAGMYAVRFEPIDPKSGTAPVVAFRGSEFNEKMVDWRSDITDGTIGQRQYKESQKAIDDLMKVAPGQKLEVTGHSLGGALAQKAAAEHAASIGAVSTFQAPGVDAADAAKFNANKADGVKVNHHYVSSDIVHRAGEQKLDGNFYEHHVPGAGMGDIGASHTANLLHNTGQVDENGVNKYIDSDKNGFDNKRDSVTHHEKDAQGDRHFFEGLRQLLGNGLGGPIEGVVTGIAKAGGGIMTGLKDIGAGMKNGFMSAMHGITGGMSTAWDGAKKGGSELVGGFKQMMSGNILSGLGGMGKGLMSGAGGLLSGAGQAIGGVASGAWEGAKGLGSGLWNAGKGLLGGADDVIGGVGRGLLGGAKGLAHLGTGAAEWLADKSGALANYDTGNGIGNGLLQAVGGTGKAIGEAGAGIGNAANSALSGIGRGAGAAWDGLKQGGGSLVQGAGQIFSGSPLAGLGTIGKGLVGGAGSILKGGADAAGSVVKGIGSGAMALGKGAWDTGKSVVQGIGTAGKSIASGVGKAAGAAWDGAKNVGGALASGAKKLLSGW
jgi:hypothetical protein